MKKPPFGFRQDEEEKPDPDENESKQEISNTSCSTERAWSPNYQHYRVSRRSSPVQPFAQEGGCWHE